MWAYLERWIKTSTISIFQPADCRSELQEAGAFPCSSRCQVDPPWTGDRTSFHCRATRTHPYSSDGDNGDMPISPKCTSLRCGRKSGSPRENPCRHVETVQTIQIVASTRSQFFFPSTLEQNNIEQNDIIQRMLYLKTFSKPLVYLKAVTPALTQKYSYTET